MQGHSVINKISIPTLFSIQHDHASNDIGYVATLMMIVHLYMFSNLNEYIKHVAAGLVDGDNLRLLCGIGL